MLLMLTLYEPVRVLSTSVLIQICLYIGLSSRRMGGSNHRYSKLLEVYEELEQAEAVQRRLGCPVIDTTELSIEETAARVIRLVEQRQAEATVS